jgi:hypothetical protein
MEAGVRFGMMPEESLKFGGAMAGMAGVGLDRLDPRYRDMAMAAQTQYGIEADVSGALLRGGRMGQGGFETTLKDTISDALSLGLEGQDLTSHVREIASRIMQFEQTGIPVARESLAHLQVGFAASLGPLRGQIVGQQFQAAIQQVGTAGPQNAAQFMALRMIGGYQGGGVEDLVRAQINMETGQGGPEGGASRFLATDPRKGLGWRAKVVQTRLGGIGMTIPTHEAMSYVQGKGDLEDRVKEYLDKSKASVAAQTPLEGVPELVPPEISREARTALEAFKAAEPLIAFMQTQREADTKALANIAMFAKELNLAATTANKVSEKLGEALKGIESVMDKALTALGKR